MSERFSNKNFSRVDMQATIKYFIPGKTKSFNELLDTKSVNDDWLNIFTFLLVCSKPLINQIPQRTRINKNTK